jgi:hypothetical protein
MFLKSYQVPLHEDVHRRIEKETSCAHQDRRWHKIAVGWKMSTGSAIIDLTSGTRIST